ncbi:DUF1440 domain-containing protein [uncultured Salegentibacter sp.]|uniref:DUF1440 domain-containing protein n=1 Tax=uncultured Salegentibacter sp. TaxID=259320 RepID=UPI0030DB9182
MKISNILFAFAGSMGSGYLATKVMEKVSMKLFELGPQKDQEKEEEVRPGPPFKIAAKKTLKNLGFELNEDQEKMMGQVFHFGLGMGWAGLYPILKYTNSFSTTSNGLITGASLSLIVDEGITPALGFSAPNKKYPTSTHIRGFLAHLVYGVAVAVIYEGISGIVSKIGERR